MTSNTRVEAPGKPVGKRKPTIQRYHYILMGMLVLSLIFVIQVNDKYTMDKLHTANAIVWEQAIINQTDPLRAYKDLDYTNDLVIKDATLNYLKDFFSKTGENENMLYLYGYKKDNKTFVERAEYKPQGIISANSTAVGFWKANTSDALGYLHNHPEFNCFLSDGDLDVSKTHHQIIALYCLDKVLWYDGSFHLLNITKEVK